MESALKEDGTEGGRIRKTQGQQSKKCYEGKEKMRLNPDKPKFLLLQMF